MFGLKRCLTACSQETLDVSALLVILFRPVLSVSEWAGCGSAGVVEYRYRAVCEVLGGSPIGEVLGDAADQARTERPPIPG